MYKDYLKTNKAKDAFQRYIFDFTITTINIVNYVKNRLFNSKTKKKK